jgi:hypothetical protein
MKFVMIFLSVLSTSAFADQCAWNSKTDAASAMKLLKGNDVITWCQNCGEKTPSYIAKVSAAKITTPSAGYKEITITTSKGDEQIDLAYTYVRTATNVFTNMAQLVGCPSTGATSFIQTGPGVKKTAHYYNQVGERVDVLSSTEETTISAAQMKSDRLPASKK